MPNIHQIYIYNKNIQFNTISIGVRGGGADSPPGLKNFRANSVFRASAGCSKILHDKKIFQYSEKFQGNSVFQGKN